MPKYNVRVQRTFIQVAWFEIPAPNWHDAKQRVLAPAFSATRARTLSEQPIEQIGDDEVTDIEREETT